ncbi:MAG: PilZ domain-containing protein [Candidatus Omnitrophota bacterium]
MKKEYSGAERRQFVRLDYTAPLSFKVCKKETLSKILEGYTGDISQGGILCNIKEKVRPGDILWLSFERSSLVFCEDLEKRSLIYQNGVIGKVARVNMKKDKTFDVGLQFVTREEKNQTNIYPRMYFIEKAKKGG